MLSKFSHRRSSVHASLGGFSLCVGLMIGVSNVEGALADSALDSPATTTNALLSEPVNMISLNTDEAEHTLEKPTVSTATEEIPFNTIEQNSNSLDKGEKEVVQKGEAGFTQVTNINDGEVTVYLELPSIDEIVHVGVREEVVSADASTVKNSPTSTTFSVSGSKADWMEAAGIPESDWAHVDYIVSRESGWNPNAVNSSSGACGLAQSLPCGKSEVYGAWNDPVAQLKWQHDYVNGRYGGYAGAANHSRAYGWY